MTHSEPDAAPPPRVVARQRAPRWPGIVRTVGELLVTGGLVVLLFVVYELFVTDVIADRKQDQLSQELYDDWDRAGGQQRQLAEVEIGDAFGVLRIPRLGEDYARVILEGTDEDELSQGPGHYADTAMPGEPGNVALAGHRVGKGSPFLDLDRMQAGDPIVVETVDSWFVYRVLGDAATGDIDADPSGIPGRHIVRPEDIEVISPTPGVAEDAAPTGSYLTLTTCHPKYSARQRLIIHAALDGGPVSKAEWPNGPAALYES